MLKKKIFKWFFKKELDDLVRLRIKVDELEEENQDLEDLIRLMRDSATTENLMRESLGLPYIDFANVNEDGKPPHYLKDLDENARKSFIAELESIYANEKFQKVVAYVINLLGNHSIQKAEEDKMRNGRIGIVGIRTLMSEFIGAHNEYVNSRKQPDEFDPNEVL